MRYLRIILACLICVFVFTGASRAATFTVTNTNSIGGGSLYQALVNAEANSGADLIYFDIPGAGPHTILVTRAFPVQTGPVRIDGYTQPGSHANTNPRTAGSNAALMIELDCTNRYDYGTNNRGACFEIHGGSSVIRGLAINRNGSGPAVFLDFLGDNAVEGCFLGTNVTGTLGRGNMFGVYILSDDNTIGGLSAMARNVISSNEDYGVMAGGTGNLVFGNLIGTTASGTVARGNGLAGVYVEGNSNNIGGATLASRNVISGSALGSGVHIEIGDNNDILGNYIGTDVTGTADLGNRYGVFIQNASSNWVGGTSAGVRNVISGNNRGVFIADGSHSNIVAGNYIGTDAAGTGALANSANGVEILGSNGNYVGGTTAGYRNVISGNGDDAVRIADGALNNRVQANYIGTAANGTDPLGNGGDGVHVTGSAGGTIFDIGGISAGLANVIAYNAGNGITVMSTVTGANIRHNSIHSNTGLGIDLGGDGVTTNDLMDPDTGANNLQNFPEFTVASCGDSLVIAGTLYSEPITTYDIEFFASPSSDPSGYGEGAVYLATRTLTTDGGVGAGDFEFTIPGAPAGHHVTATAIDPAGNTSEFSPCVEVGVGLVVTNTNATGAGSLYQACLNSEACAGPDTITFNIPGAGPHTIQVEPAFVPQTEPVVIDGFTQPGSSPNTNPRTAGSNAVMKIEIDCTNRYYAGGGDRLACFDIRGGNSIIRGLVINRTGGSAISFFDLGNNAVEGCFLGTDVNGNLGRGNDFGVYISCDDNTVGGFNAMERNVISDNLEYGIEVAGSGNYVYGNLIGTTASGTVERGNHLAGVYVSGTNNFIGGPTLAQRNIISGSEMGAGVHLVNDNNKIRGNYIGTDVTGNADLGNDDGVFIQGASSNWVGGASGDPRNVISGNGDDGILIDYSSLSTQVRGNYIGTDYTGANPLGNGRHGVYINGANSLIGGALELGNTIAFNDSTGIVVVNHNANRIRFNSIFDNGGLGIDLGNDGVTLNDLNDADTGANTLQNFPVLTSATGGTSSRIVGSFHSTPNTSFSLDFFYNPTCDASSYGEGKHLIGSLSTGTDGNGDAAFDKLFSTIAPGGSRVTATATTLSTANTSEFSQCIEFINTTTGTNVTVLPVDEETGETPVQITYDDVAGSGNTTLQITETGPPVPGQFIVGDPASYYHLQTDANYNDSLLVCFTYDDTALPGSESELYILHYDTTLVPPDYVDITASVDTVANIICGRTATLSPFVVALPNPASGVEPPAPQEPDVYALHQNVPNPFNPSTRIQYDVPNGGERVTLQVFDVKGRLVVTLVDDYQTSGRRTVAWNGRDTHGRTVATGVYFYRMAAGNFVQTRKMLLIK